MKWHHKEKAVLSWKESWRLTDDTRWVNGMRQLQAIVGTKGGQVLFFSSWDTKRWSQLFFKKKKKKNAFLKSKLPGAARTIPALFSYAISVGGQMLLTFQIELAIFLDLAAALRKSFWMQISHRHLIFCISSWKYQNNCEKMKVYTSYTIRYGSL